MKELVRVAKEAFEKLGEFIETFKEEGSENVQLSELAAGEKFTTDIGDFIVIRQCDGMSIVITEDLYRGYVRFSDDTLNYSESSLKKLCDGEIYEEFVKVFGAENIVEHSVKDFKSLDGQQLADVEGCKVRPLTFEEARSFNALLVNEELDDCYWTITPWSSEERGWKYSIAVVSPSGDFYRSYYDYRSGVRPVCILKSHIFVSRKVA